MNVYIITYCSEPDYLQGTTLTFKTLRKGFPTSRIHVIDNASIEGSRRYIQQCAESVHATYYQLQQELNHEDIIQELVLHIWEGQCILIDPDMCFWQNCEHWQFNALIAGRLIPRFHDDYTRCITEPRLHTSFWWVNDAEKLRQAIKDICERYFDFKPFLPYMYRNENNQWIRFDTGASLYTALLNEMQAFTHLELEAYDHLFSGTNYKEIADKLNEITRDEFMNTHKQSMSDYRNIQGIWKRQEEYFKEKEQVQRANLNNTR